MKRAFCFVFVSIGLLLFSGEIFASWHPTPCLNMLAKEFKPGDKLSPGPIGGESFRAIAEMEQDPRFTASMAFFGYSEKDAGLHWSYSQRCGEGKVWSVKAVVKYPKHGNSEFFLSYVDLRGFHGNHAQIRWNEKMHNLWHLLFGEDEGGDASFYSAEGEVYGSSDPSGDFSASWASSED